MADRIRKLASDLIPGDRWAPTFGKAFPVTFIGQSKYPGFIRVQYTNEIGTTTEQNVKPNETIEVIPAPKLRLSKVGSLEYRGTLGQDYVRLSFSTGANEGWSILINGEWHWLATSYQKARKEAVRRHHEFTAPQEPRPIRPVTGPGWYELDNGQAGFIEVSGISKDGSTGTRITQIRPIAEVRGMATIR